MDDEEYAHELFDILTRPLDPDEPVDANGTGRDGIDRDTGFGTEVRVTFVDVVPGEFGEQIEVGFSLTAPERRDLPLTGSVLLPFAAEWREAQGYASPATHAPQVAREIVRGAWNPLMRGENDGDPPVMIPDAGEQHALLLEVFGTEGDVEEVTPGRLVVRRPRVGRDLTVLVTPDQWARVVQKHGLRRAWLFEHFNELLASGHRDNVFLVFWDGDLVRSVREELPPVDGTLRALLALRAAGPPELGPDDGWYAYPPVTKDDQLPG